MPKDRISEKSLIRHRAKRHIATFGKEQDWVDISGMIGKDKVYLPVQYMFHPRQVHIVVEVEQAAHYVGKSVAVHFCFVCKGTAF